MKSTFVWLLCVLVGATSALKSAWHWKCLGANCRKEEIGSNVTSRTLLSLAECRILCADTILWPQPTGTNYVEKKLSEININKITLNELGSEAPGAKLVTEAFEIFVRQKKDEFGNVNSSDASVNLTFTIIIEDLNQNTLTLDIDESYNLNINRISTEIEVTIKAATFFGARHSLETVGQLLIFDDLRDRILIPNNVIIEDRPTYKWRGLGLDTARNFIDIKAIKRTLNAMAASKLNTFHWHLVDTQSFPYVSKSRPEMSKLGAYSPKKVYSNDDVTDIIKYARVRGIRVVPEMDAPAHVGEGWQNTGAVLCFNQRPMSDYCTEPPCGQLNPVSPQVYDILEDLYGDMLEQFGTEVFHMGGDEVNFNCWNSTEEITTFMVHEKGWGLNRSDFMLLWNYFQNQAYAKLIDKAGKSIPAILWSSALTASPEFSDNFSNKNYIIQIWEAADDVQIQTLLDQDFTLILSNYDALYLDCGYAGWITGGNNWCSPYKGWQVLYENRPAHIAGTKMNQILGAEALLWTEEALSTSVDSKLWPRAAALAEVLWTEPSSSWIAADQRMLIHTERLVSLGIWVDALQPEWCLKNEGNCRDSNLDLDLDY